MANATKVPTHLRLLIYVEEADSPTETATQSASEATALLHEVLLTARTVAANEKDVAAIQNSMLSVLIAIRASEAATAAASDCSCVFHPSDRALNRQSKAGSQALPTQRQLDLTVSTDFDKCPRFDRRQFQLTALNWSGKQ